MAAFMSWSSVTDVSYRRVFRTGSGKAVQRSGHGKSPVWVESSLVFCEDSIIGDCSVDVRHQAVLSSARNCPRP